MITEKDKKLLIIIIGLAFLTLIVFDRYGDRTGSFLPYSAEVITLIN